MFPGFSVSMNAANLRCALLLSFNVLTLCLPVKVINFSAATTGAPGIGHNTSGQVLSQQHARHRATKLAALGNKHQTRGHERQGDAM